MSAKSIVKSAVRWMLLSLGLMLTGIMAAGVVILYGEYGQTHWLPPARRIVVTLSPRSRLG